MAIMGRWLSRLKASWLFVLGFVLVYFGASGAFNVASQFWPFSIQQDASGLDELDEGFAPWTMPLELASSESAPELDQADIPLEVAIPTREITAEAQGPEDPVDAAQPASDEIEDTSAPTATPEPVVRPDAEMPRWVSIASIDLDAPIIQTGTKLTWFEGQQYEQWLAPDEFAVGWHDTSARLGELGNTVLNGHHNVYGMVFGKLVDVSEGDLITVRGGQYEFFYMITNKMILPEKSVGLAQRLENARWILPSEDERLTLVTCWPAESNTHRLIVVAQPVGARPLE
jgi:sortase A